MIDNGVRVIFSTIDSAEAAERLASALVEERLVACVNVVQGVRSHYLWQGRACCENEMLLIIKTTGERAGAACRRLADLHPYDVPEIVEMPVVGGHPPYLRWVQESVGGP